MVCMLKQTMQGAHVKHSCVRFDCQDMSFIKGGMLGGVDRGRTATSQCSVLENGSRTGMNCNLAVLPGSASDKSRQTAGIVTHRYVQAGNNR